MTTRATNFHHVDPELQAVASAAAAVFSAAPEDVMTGASDGWFGVGLPESVGGSGGTLQHLAPVIEAAGAALAATAVAWSTGIVGRTLLGAATVPEESLSELASGERVFAVPSGGARATAAHIAVADSGLLSCDVVALGPSSAWLALPIVTGSLEQVALIAPGHPAVTATALEAMDLTRPWTRFQVVDLDLNEVEAVAGAGLLSRWDATAGVVHALDAVGAARSALDQTVAYAAAREQFGRPLGSFQAYKHRCATALVELKLAQSVAFRAAATVGGDTDSFGPAASLQAARAATGVCSAVIQLHGGIGFSWETGVHRYLRRSRADELLRANDGAESQLLQNLREG
jgi:alkylation response protein AidB-like acyl-CoA dehydrogenase